MCPVKNKFEGVIRGELGGQLLGPKRLNHQSLKILSSFWLTSAVQYAGASSSLYRSVTSIHFMCECV